MSKNAVNKIDNISLSAKQIKSKLEDTLAYDHKKYSDTHVLFDSKPHTYYKLPFSDFKIAISEELYNQDLLVQAIHQYNDETKLIEEKVVNDQLLEEFTPEEEDNFNVIEEVCEFDEIDDEPEGVVQIKEENEDELDYEEFIDDDIDEFEDEDDEDELALLPYDHRAKKPRNRSTIKIVDVAAVIEKIKREAREKNEGKPVIGRRQINKMLKPYLLKKAKLENIGNMNSVDGIDDSLTSIDIYLNAVDKIANINDKPIHDKSNNSLELNLKDILDDLEK